MESYNGAKKPGWNRRKTDSSVEPVEEAVVEEAPAKEKKAKKLSFKFNFKPSKPVIIGAIAAVVVIGGIIAAITLKGNNNEKLSASLVEMGRDWYENFYYDGFEESKRADILSRFKDIGIKVDLDNLSRYNTEVNAEKIKAFKPDEEGGCDKTETKIVIKPKDPYGKTDYEIEAILVCGDQKNEDKNNQ